MTDDDTGRCECGHLTDAAMGYPPDAKAARESQGPHHTPIRCVMYRRPAQRVMDAAIDDIMSKPEFAALPSPRWVPK